MLPEDDYLRSKPADGEPRTVWRIALMALMGCLMLMSVLVLQAGAAPRGDGLSNLPGTVEQLRQDPAPGVGPVAVTGQLRQVRARVVPFPSARLPHR